MTTVKTFDDNDIKKLLKECNPRLKQYIEAQKVIIVMNRETIALSIKKIKELSEYKWMYEELCE